MRKMEVMKKALSILLTFCMVLSCVPTTAFAVTEDGLCEHHAEHTAECGYAEAVAGADCAHVHDTAVCGYVAEVQEVLCTCTATDESGVLIHTEGCSYIPPVAGADCTHTHDDNCGYVEAVTGVPCAYACAECAAVTTYSVTVAEGITNGTVTADKATAAEGATVTLTIAPNEGCELDALTVTYGDDNTAVTVAEDNTFTMPAGNVTVTAVFREKAAEPVTVYFDNSAVQWSQVNAYAWGADNPQCLGPWPGTVMTLVEGETAIYSLAVPAGADTIIFNNGSAAQTADQTLGIDNCFKAEETEEDGLYIGSWYTYPCTHANETFTDNGDGTHSGTCPDCGADTGKAAHTPENGKCTGCGGAFWTIRVIVGANREDTYIVPAGKDATLNGVYVEEGYVLEGVEVSYTDTYAPVTGFRCDYETITIPGEYVTADLTVGVSVRTLDIENAHNHVYVGVPTFTWAEDPSAATATWVCLSDASTNTVDCTVTFQTQDATCTAEGKTTYTATATWNGTDFTDTKTASIPVDANNHSYDEGKCTGCGANQPVTVTLNGNGGEIFNGDTFDYQEMVTVLYSNALDLAEYTEKFRHQGHQLTSWNTQADGKGTGYEADGSITVTGDITLYAQWEVNTYTVTWIVEGDTYATTQVKYGDPITAPETDPTKIQEGCTAYTFASWEGLTDGMTMPAENQSFTALFTEGEAHDYKIQKDDTHHWYICSRCDKEDGKATHANVADTDGKCDTCGIQLAAAVTTAEGTTYFIQFDDAFATAQASTGSTLTLLADVTGRYYVESGTFTLDLNGRTITNTEGSGLSIAGYVDLTVTDSSESGTGAVVGTDYAVDMLGDLTVTGSAQLKFTDESGATITTPGGVDLRAADCDGWTIKNNGSGSVSGESYRIPTGYVLYVVDEVTGLEKIMETLGSSDICTIRDHIHEDDAADRNHNCDKCGVLASNHSYGADDTCTECGMGSGVLVTYGDGHTEKKKSVREALADDSDEEGAADNVVSVQLLCDVTVSSFDEDAIFVFEGTVTLDLNGYSVTASETYEDGVVIYSVGDLTITDSSAARTGSVSPLFYQFAGNLTIEGAPYIETLGCGNSEDEPLSLNLSKATFERLKIMTPGAISESQITGSYGLFDADGNRVESLSGSSREPAIGSIRKLCSTHTWEDADCDTPKTCSVCQATEGEALGHIDENTDHNCDRDCGKTGMGDHADTDGDGDHVCDYGCGAVDVTEHTPGSSELENWVNATCTEGASYDLVQYCTECDTELSREHRSNPAPGHSWIGAYPTWADDFSSCTAHRICADDDTHSEIATATKIESTVIDPASCTEEGMIEYKAYFEEEWVLDIASYFTEVDWIPITAHSVEYTYTDNGDCTHNVNYTCHEGVKETVEHTYTGGTCVCSAVQMLTLTVNSNGGVLDEEMKELLIEAGCTVTDDSVIMSAPYGEELEAVIDGLTKEGHTLTGFIDQNGKTYAIGEGFTLTEDMTMTAQWEETMHTVTFVYGMGNLSKQTIGEVTPQALNPYTGDPRTGHSFNGWNTKSDGSGTAYTDGQEITLTGDIMLYPQWKVNNYKITWDMDGGQCSMELPAYADYGTTVTVSGFSKPGYYLAGLTDQDGNELSPVVIVDIQYSFIMPDKDVTITAEWGEYLYVSFFDGLKWETQTADWMPDLAAFDIATGIHFNTNGLNSRDDQIAGDYAVQWYDASGSLLEEAPTDAGTYTIKVTLGETASEKYILAADTLTYTINPLDLSTANVGLQWPNGQPSYNGQQQLPDAVGATVGNSSYKLPEGSYSFAPVAGKNCTNAGTAYCLIVGDGKNVVGQVEKSYYINRLSLTLPDTAERVYAYDGTPKATDFSNETVPEGYASVEPVYWYEAGSSTRLAEAPTDAGEYEVYVRYTPADTVNYATVYRREPYTIDPANITVTANAVSKTYGHADPELTYTVSGLVNGDAMSGELTRAEGENVGEYAITQGTLTAGGNYTISFTGANLTINAKPITSNDVKLSGSLTYTGSEQTQPITVTEGITYTVTGNKATNVGTYELVVTGTGNHTGSVTLDWSIAKKAASVMAPTANSLTYTGGAQTLVTPRTVDGGKLLYSLTESGEYTEAVPTGTDAGLYTVWYYVRGDSNHSDTQKASVTVTIAKADPAIGSVTANVVNDTMEISAIVLNRENTDVAGTLTVDDGQTLKLGDNEITWTLTPANTGNYNTVSGKVTVTVRDTIAPTGTVTLSTDSWSEFLNTITFGKYFKETQKVSVTAADNLSGVARIEYYETKDVLNLDGVKTLEDAKWTVMDGGEVSVTAEDTKQFIYYIRITDNSGNVSYLATNGAEFDTTAPVITGVENGKTYYTTQVVTVTDKNLETVTLNGEPVTGTITLDGNKDASYTIVATDKAGNSTTVTVTMAQIADISNPMDGLTDENVTSDDKEVLKNIVDTAEELLKDDDLTDEEKDALEEAKKKAEDLLDVIEEAASDLVTEHTEKVEDITSENVKPEDKEDLEKAKENLEKALEENSGNYTNEEKQQIQEEIDRIDDALETIEKVENITAAIEKLPDSVEPDDEETAKDILDAKVDYDDLTDHEKSLIDDELKDKLDDLLAALTDYKITKGDGSKWTKSSGMSLSFTANGPLSKFVGIEIDGKGVDAKNYTVKADQTTITLKASYLETLETSNHTITVLYTDGETEGTFTVQAKPTSPATGDDSNIMLWSGMLCVSTLGLVLLLVDLKRRRPKK